MSLSAREVTLLYGRSAALHEVTMDVLPGEVTALVGHNAAGKSSLLRAVVGLAKPAEGLMMLDERPLTGPAHRRAEQGIALVPEGRQLFGTMTVLDNLLIGAYTARKALRRQRLDTVLNLFPILGDRAAQVAGSLSGGEAQLLAIGRALMSGPRFLLLDEPTLGLAPKAVVQVFEQLQTLAGSGIGILIAEQNVRALGSMCSSLYLLEHGRIAADFAGAVTESTVEAVSRRLWQGQGGKL